MQKNIVEVSTNKVLGLTFGTGDLALNSADIFLVLNRASVFILTSNRKQLYELTERILGMQSNLEWVVKPYLQNCKNQDIPRGQDQDIFQQEQSGQNATPLLHASDTILGSCRSHANGSQWFHLFVSL